MGHTWISSQRDMRTTFLFAVLFAALLQCPVTDASTCVFCGAECPDECWEAAWTKCDSCGDLDFINIVASEPACKQWWSTVSRNNDKLTVLQTAAVAVRAVLRKRAVQKGSASEPEKGYLQNALSESHFYCISKCATLDRDYCNAAAGSCTPFCGSNSPPPPTPSWGRRRRSGRRRLLGEATNVEAPSSTDDDNDQQDEEDELLKLLDTQDRNKQSSWQCW